MTSIPLSEKVLIPTRFKVNLRTCRAIRILVQELTIPKISWSKNNTVVYKMPNGNRGHLVTKEAQSKPGPGQYDDHNNFGQNANSFMIRGRPQE